MQKAIKLSKYNNVLSLYKKYKSILHFIIVGCINTGVDFITFAMLYSLWGFDKLTCQAAGYSMGIVNSFAMNKLWTFKRQKSKINTTVQFIEFVGVNLMSLGVSLIGLNLLNSHAHINIYISKVIVTAFVLVFNYAVYNWVIFKK